LKKIALFWRRVQKTIPIQNPRVNLLWLKYITSIHRLLNLVWSVEKHCWDEKDFGIGIAGSQSNVCEWGCQSDGEDGIGYLHALCYWSL